MIITNSITKSKRKLKKSQEFYKTLLQSTANWVIIDIGEGYGRFNKRVWKAHTDWHFKF